MPYIKADDGRRDSLRHGDIAQSAGELNYQIFYYVKNTVLIGEKPRVFIVKDIADFVKNFLGEKPNYQRYNDMTGAVIRCYKEIQRRLNYNADYLKEIMESYDDEIATYEDVKIGENGDVE